MSRYYREHSRTTYCVAMACVLLALAGCKPQPGNGGTDGGAQPRTAVKGPNADLVELAPYQPEQVVADPAGSDATIVGGRIIVDFDNTLDLGTVDSVLAAHQLMRIGIVGSINLVTAEILDGKTELEAQADIKTEAVVQRAPLAYIFEPDDFAGENQPPLAIGAPPVGEVPDKGDTAINWHHYVMDTFAAHALADAVIGGGLSDVELAVVDWGFQTQRGTGAGDTTGSILVDPLDRDLVPKIMAPVYNTNPDDDSNPGTTTGVVGVASNPGLVLQEKVGGAVKTNLHGLKVCSAAGAAGDDLLGTGKHVRIRPVRYPTQGVFVSGDPYIARSYEYAVAALMYLTRPEFDHVKVINMSWGHEGKGLRDDELAELEGSFWDVFFFHEVAGRILTASAGNDSTSGLRHPPASMSINRDPNKRNDPSYDEANELFNRFSNIMAVAGTSLPVIEGAGAAFVFEGRREADYAYASDNGSNYGNMISVSAPAQNVAVLVALDSVQPLQDGTSFASPMVAGLAAEMFAVDPTATSDQIIDIIQKTADDLVAGSGDVGWDEFFGHGRINCWKAILSLLNRKEPAERPKWLGIRFRSASDAIRPEQFIVNGNPVPNTIVKRVPDLAAVNEDNTQSVPYVAPAPTLLASLFSFQTAEIAPTAGTPIPLLKVNAAGATVYEIPLRLDDLINARVADSLFDDFVVTINVRTPTASLYGRVTRQGLAAPDGEVLYFAHDGSSKTVSTDSDGYYAIYDARPDQAMGVVASDNKGSVTQTTTAPAMRATQLNFELEEPSFPRTYRGTATRTVFVEWDFLGGGSMQDTQTLDMEITLWPGGNVAAAMIGVSGGPNFGGNETTHRFEYTCPADAPRNAGQLVSLFSWSFVPQWGGTFDNNGTYTIDYGSSYNPMTISGSFSNSSISGSGAAWPDPTDHPRGAEFTIPVYDPTIGCTNTEDILYYRVEVELEGTLYVAPAGN
ncbi:MAG: S8 family serine peptidase [Phycisphaerales bacterium]|nr:S8 family serine peptidase [Phycisphaerales bacterium]